MLLCGAMVRRSPSGQLRMCQGRPDASHMARSCGDGLLVASGWLCTMATTSPRSPPQRSPPGAGGTLPAAGWPYFGNGRTAAAGQPRHRPRAGTPRPHAPEWRSGSAYAWSAPGDQGHGRESAEQLPALSLIAGPIEPGALILCRVVGRVVVDVVVRPGVAAVGPR